MGWCRRGNLALNGFRRLALSFTPQNLNIQHGSKICQSRYFGSNVTWSSSFSSISCRLGTYAVGVKRSLHNPFLVGGKRFYYVDPYNVQHFKPRGPRGWFQNPKRVFIVMVLGSGILITLYFGNIETIPYTKRTHWILLSKAMERQLGEIQFKKTKANFNGKILPPVHPESVRVRMIAKDIIDALHRGSKPATSHLDGLNWEVLVVNESIANAFCLPSGKIVVFTGLLKHFRSDAEIATIIGHEVGHVVARHGAEGMTRNLCLIILRLILYQFATRHIVNTVSSYFLRLPFSRRMEMEADYIGLLLIASAGYDPRVAPLVYKKMEKTTNDFALKAYLSTHPSGKKRAEQLGQAKVMDEALTLYMDVRARRGV